jgi:hypothetical protein
MRLAEKLDWKGLNVNVKRSTVSFDVHESIHRDTTMKITNKMHYIV